MQSVCVFVPFISTEYILSEWVDYSGILQDSLDTEKTVYFFTFVHREEREENPSKSRITHQRTDPQTRCTALPQPPLRCVRGASIDAPSR